MRLINDLTGDLINIINDLKKRIPPKIMFFFLAAISAYFMIAPMLKIIEIWPELFSGEEVIRIW